MTLTSVSQPGLAVFFEALLGFDGDEFYTAKVILIKPNESANSRRCAVFDVTCTVPVVGFGGKNIWDGL